MSARNKRNLLNFLITSLVFLTILPAALTAEKYPTKEIQVVITTPAGTVVDVAARVMKDILGENLGVPIIVNNRTGAGGATGTLFLVKSKPDGYTIGCIASAHTLVLPVTIPDVPFKYSDLDPLCKYFIDPVLVYCRKDAPWKSWEELVADAKKRPEQITCGVTTHSITEFQMKGILKNVGISMIMVPLNSPHDNIYRVLGGNLDVGVSTVNTLAAQIKAGTVRVFFQTAPERVKFFPEIPSYKEKGLSDPVINLYGGIFAPIGMPKPIRKTLQDALEKTIKEPNLKGKLEEVQLNLDYLPAEAFAKEIEENYKRLINFLKTKP